MEECPVYQYQMRHGESKQNAHENYDGGGHDDGPNGPVNLTSVGELQAATSAYGAQKLELPITRIYHSKQPRAKQTATTFAENYRGRPPIQELSGIHEIDHGSLQRDWPDVTNPDARPILKGEVEPIRAKGLEAMRRALGGCGLSLALSLRLDDIYEYLDWITFLGRVDGDSYLEAGMRGNEAMDAICDQDGAMAVWHNGLGRQTRLLATALTREQRMQLANSYQENVAEVAAFTKQQIAQRKVHGKALPLDVLTDRLKPVAHALAPIALQLSDWRVRPMRGIGRVGNATIAEVGIREDGKWVLGRLVKSEIADKTKPLGLNNVNISLAPAGWA